MAGKLIRLALVIFAPYVFYLAAGEYFRVHFQHHKATYPFGGMQKLERELVGGFDAFSYEQQLLLISGIALAITLLLVVSWFIRKLFYTAVICGACFVFYVLYVKYIR